MYQRYAVYYVPCGDALTVFGASWLGWDVNRGREARQPKIAGIGEVTEKPRKYGLHGTLKPPFRLAPHTDVNGFKTDVRRLAQRLPVASVGGVCLTTLGRFIALVPDGDQGQVASLARACVSELDSHRAALTSAEMAHRRAAGLSPRQDALLHAWGYPYVMEEFRFHITLTGRLRQEDLTRWRDHLEAELPQLPRPFTIDSIALCGERSDGRFEVIERFALEG